MAVRTLQEVQDGRITVTITVDTAEPSPMLSDELYTFDELMQAHAKGQAGRDAELVEARRLLSESDARGMQSDTELVAARQKVEKLGDQLTAIEMEWRAAGQVRTQALAELASARQQIEVVDHDRMIERDGRKTERGRADKAEARVEVLTGDLDRANNVRSAINRAVRSGVVTSALDAIDSEKYAEPVAVLARAMRQVRDIAGHVGEFSATSGNGTSQA